MKLTGVAAARYFARPEADRTGLLIFGADAMRVALRRQEVIAALIGPEGEAEMRLTRLPAGELRKNPAALNDAVKAVGFFPGPRVVFVEDASETATPAVTAALKDWQKGDAQIIVAAGSLTAKSGLRKIFEAHPNAYAIGIYDDPPSREEIEDILHRAGLRHIDPAAMTDLLALARMLDPGDFRQTVEKIALYKWNDPAPLASSEVAACAPATIEADVDDVLDIVAEGRPGELGPMMRRIEGQGIQPVALAIQALRHFRSLHVVASDPGGPGAGIGRLRPPAFGPRRDKLLSQAQRWGMFRLEEALKVLVEADLTLRSASKAPQMALLERALMRLAMLGARR
ncbi:DNA polymerase III subunit delta [Sinirhodobacter populi]|uniref:DNA-directed DNA polymerase n=1 Tax=Paenirhodobacter populi TaxID=2306993 RepID=A0A443K145_9RHOB|nr:DNA polymerase III subunit delta [Sinirhodobacter populi]RWR26475.1 DNA polymerase III subunit delta [Sinirhodobacter populi]